MSLEVLASSIALPYALPDRALAEALFLSASLVRLPIDIQTQSTPHYARCFIMLLVARPNRPRNVCIAVVTWSLNMLLIASPLRKGQLPATWPSRSRRANIVVLWSFRCSGALGQSRGTEWTPPACMTLTSSLQQQCKTRNVSCLPPVSAIAFYRPSFG